MAFGPSPTLALVRREVLTSLRSWKSLTLLVLLFAPLYLSANVTLNRIAHGNLYDAILIRDLFETLCTLLLLTAVTVVPVSAATTIYRDRASGTLEMLLVTHITRSQILLAQAGAILLVFGIVAVALLPFLGVTYFFVGVEVSALLHAAFVIAITASACAALGLLASVVAVKPGQAVATAVSLVVFFEWILPTFFAWSQGAYSGNVAQIHTHFRPDVALDPANLSALPYFGLYQAAIAASAFTFSLAWFRGSRPFRRFASLGHIWTPRHPLHGNGISEKYSNPILAWELGKHPCFGRKNWIIFGALCLPCAGYMYYLRYEPMDLIGTLMFAERLLLLLLLPVLVAVRINPDMQPENIDGLRTTLVTSREFVLGKSLALLQGLWPFCLPPFFAAAVFAALVTLPRAWHRTDFLAILLLDGLIWLPAHGIAITMLSVASACHRRTITSAILAAYANLLVSLLFVLPVLMVPTAMIGMLLTQILAALQVPYGHLLVTSLATLVLCYVFALLGFHHAVAVTHRIWLDARETNIVEI